MFGEIYAHDVGDIDRAEPGLEYRWCIAGDWKLIESADGKTKELYNVTPTRVRIETSPSSSRQGQINLTRGDNSSQLVTRFGL